MTESAPPPTPPPLRRLHAATLLIGIPASLRPVLLPLIAVYIVTPGDSDDGGSKLLIFALIGAGLSLTANVARFVSLRYGVVANHLVIRSGILFRRSRSIPVARIQNIDLKSGLLHRALGVAEVRVETAGSEGSEAHLAVVGRDEAELFRSELLQLAGRAGDTAEPPADEVLHRAELGQLFLAGATENRVGVIVAFLFGLLEFFGEPTRESLRDAIEAISERLPALGTATQITAGVLFVLLLFVAGWAVSITLTVVKHFGFVVTRRARELRSRQGLFTRLESVIPLARVQLLRLDANPFRRLLHTATVSAQTAGAGGKEQRSGEEILSPLMDDDQAPALCRAVLPELDLDHVELQRVHPLAIRRGFIRYTLVGSILLVMAALALERWLLFGLPVVAAAAYGLARLRHRALRWARHGEYLVARSGIWTRRVWIVPESKVQSVRVSRSPFQRRLGLATLSIDTAGASALSHPRVIDLGLDVAEALRESLSRASNRSGLLRGGI